MLKRTGKMAARTPVELPASLFRAMLAMNDRAATPEAPFEPTQDGIAELAPLAPTEGSLPTEAEHEPANPEQLPEALPPTLEDRLRHLEDQVAVIQDTRRLEDRITERVARRLERKQANATVKAPVAAVAEPSKPPPVASIAPPPELPPVVVLEGKGGRQTWLIVDIFTEFRAMLRMFLDGRYRLFYMNWQTKVYPPLLLATMVFSWLTISAIPIVGPALDKIAELILAFFLYKVLSREASRYREISPQMKPFGHT
jgi:hypothetical protein